MAAPPRFTPLSAEEPAPKEQPREDGLATDAPGTHDDSIKEEEDGWAPGADVVRELQGTEDVYKMVVLAAFGEVRQNHLQGPDSHVHPWWILILTLPVLVVQSTVLVYLKLDYNLEQPVMFVSDQPEQDRLLAELKIMMIITVQATMLSKILGSLRVAVFLLTPEAWEMVERPWPEKVAKKYKFVSWAYRWPCVALPALVAVAAHVFLNFNICLDSISIIFNGESMKDAVYDSLAITFLADLGEQWWSIVAMIFHMYTRPDFQFQLVPVVDVARRREADSAFLKQLKACFPKGRRGRRLRKSVTMLLLAGMVLEQACIVGAAVDTNILPVARDICSWWRFDQGDISEEMMLSKQTWTFAEHALVLDSPGAAIAAIAEHPRRLLHAARAGVAEEAALDHEEYTTPADFDCHDDKYRPLGWAAFKELPRKYPAAAGYLCLFFAVFLLTQVWYHANREVMSCLERPAEGLRRISKHMTHEVHPSEEKEPEVEDTEEGEVIGKTTTEGDGCEGQASKSEMRALQLQLAEEREERESLARAVQGLLEERGRLAASMEAMGKELEALKGARSR